MKRDVDLYRKILLAMEALETSRCSELRDLPEVPHEQFAYHLKLMHDAGLVEAVDASTFDGVDWIPISITHSGHEFLDHMRSDNMWEKIKKYAGSTIGSLSIEALKAAASALISHTIIR